MSHTKSGKAFTELVLETFQFNGRLLAAGDRLAKPLGLTSSRWQVLGAIGHQTAAGGPDRPQHGAGAAERTASRRRAAGRGIPRIQPEPGPSKGEAGVSDR